MNYHHGDIFSPNHTGHELIVCHQVNCKGVMEAGLAKQIRTMFPFLYEQYKRTCGRATKSEDLLGKALFCPIRYNGNDWLIANLFAQDNFGRDRCYTDYEALRKALAAVRGVATPLPVRTLTTVPSHTKWAVGLLAARGTS